MHTIDSRKVAEKLGFTQEALVRNDRIKLHSAALGNTVIYARYDCNRLPTLDVQWK